MLLACAIAGVIAFEVALSGALAANQAPAKDRFSGTAKGSHGALAHRHGVMTVVLQPSGNGARRQVVVLISSRHCSGCLLVAGRATGTISRIGGHNPDAGQEYLLSASGDLTGSGQTKVNAVIQGTGFVSRGNEAMRLTLKGSRGSATLTAQSGAVPGFTGP